MFKLVHKSTHSLIFIGKTFDSVSQKYQSLKRVGKEKYLQIINTKLYITVFEISKLCIMMIK